MKVYFLSHAEEDSGFVTKVVKILGTDLCWTYELDVKPGDSILEYDRGIADSRIFVLFWSIHASSSDWIKDEISQARIRINRDNGFRLVVVRLDDYKLPDSLAYRLWIDGRKGVNYTAKTLQSIESDLTPIEALVGEAILKDIFQNRQTELDLIEQYSISPDSPLLISGLDGIGKTTLVKRSNATLFSHLTPILLDLDTDNTTVRIIASLAKPFSLALEATKISLDHDNIWSKLILPEISQSPKTYIIVDNYNSIYNLSPNTQSLVNRICNDLADIHKSDNPGLIIISWGLDSIEETLMKKLKSISVRELDNRYIARAIKLHLSNLFFGDFTSEQIEKLALQARGYPAVIPILSNMVSERGIEATLNNTRSLQKIRFVMMDRLLSKIEISNPEKELLLFLSISRFPLSNKLLAELGIDYVRPLQSLKRKQLIDISGSPNTLHHIIREYVIESLSKPAEITAAHSKLASLFNKEWLSGVPMSSSRAIYGSLACFHLSASGRTRQALLMHTEYIEEIKQAAIELYRRGQYKKALSFLENVRKLSHQDDPNVDYYYALSLHRVDRNEEALKIITSLASRFPKVGRYHHSLGTIFRSTGEPSKAIDSFRDAIANSSRTGKITALCSLADCLSDLGRTQDALPLISEALAIDPTDSFTVAVASRVYEEAGDIKGALKILLDGLRTSNDTRLHHRVGMILKKKGRFKDAIPYLEKAAHDPIHSLSIFALADIYLELDDIQKADEIVGRFSGNKKLNMSYISTKANIFKRQGNFDKALSLLTRARKLRPDDKVIAFSLASVLFDLGIKLVEEGNKEQGIIKLKESHIAVTESLTIDPEDTGQLQLKHKVETAIKSY